MVSHLENRSASTIWLKTAPKLPKTALFWFFGLDAVGIGMRHHFFCWDNSPDKELLTYVGFFEISSVGPSAVALFYRRSESDPLKFGIFGVLNPKNKTPQKSRMFFWMQNSM